MSISIETAQEIIGWYENTAMNTCEYAGEWMEDPDWEYDPTLAKLAENLREECHAKVYAKLCVKSALEAVDSCLSNNDLLQNVWDEDPFIWLLFGGIEALANTLEYTWTEEDNKAAKAEAEAEFDQMYETASVLGIVDRVQRGMMCAKDSALIGTVDADSYEHLYKTVQRVTEEIGEPFNGTLEDVIRASHYDPDSDTANVLTSVAAFKRKRKAA
jgi:hypothetical protein